MTLYNIHISPVKKKEVKSGGLSKICEKSVFLLFRVTQLFLTLRLFQPQSLQRLLILLLLTYILSSSLSPYTSTHNLCLPLISQDNSTSGPGFLMWIPYPIISVPKSHLDSVTLRSASVFVQYVDNFLVVSSSLEAFQEDTLHLLCALSNKGHKVSQKNLQFCKPEVE